MAKSLNIEDKLWDSFLNQSRQMEISASKRIRNFVISELNTKKRGKKQ